MHPRERAKRNALARISIIESVESMAAKFDVDVCLVDAIQRAPGSGEDLTTNQMIAIAGAMRAIALASGSMIEPEPELLVEPVLVEAIPPPLPPRSQPIPVPIQRREPEPKRKRGRPRKDL